MGCPSGYLSLISVSEAPIDGSLLNNVGDGILPTKLCLNISSLQQSGVNVLSFESEDDEGYAIDGLNAYEESIDQLWLIVAGTLVMFMQGGFFMLEAGSVTSKGTIVILFKNLLDACVGALAWWLVGYGFAYGDSLGGFIGTNNYVLADSDFSSFFFQYAFAATAATIVSGSVAERIKLEAYLAFSFILTFFIYPVVVHWGWGYGWLSAFGAVNGSLLSGDPDSNGMIDFAGSGIVHMVGGFAGLTGAAIIGPRRSRFKRNEDGTLGEPREMPGHSLILITLGVLILWFGWFGFNAGSTLCVVGCMETAAKAAVNTVMAASAACLMAVLMSYFMHGFVKMQLCLNAVIAGLVSITAGCSVVEPWGACFIGAIGTVVMIGSDMMLLHFKIDDPLQASAVHGFAGAWGLLSVGIFGSDLAVENAGYPNGGLNSAMANGEQFFVQLIGVGAIFGWTVLTSAIAFTVINKTIGLRVSLDEEMSGTSAMFGGKEYKDLSRRAIKSMRKKEVVDASTSQPVTRPTPTALIKEESQKADLSSEGTTNIEDTFAVAADISVRGGDLYLSEPQPDVSGETAVDESNKD